jgi:hypothetical protein
VDTNPDNPVIGDRSYGNDPELVGRMGVAIIHGLQDNGVAACAKHFPGHGDTDVDSHFALPAVDHTRRRLDEVELRPFRMAIEAGVASFMTAHVIVRELDETVPATLSPRIVQGMLRDEMKYAPKQWVQNWINQKKNNIANQTKAGITPELATQMLAHRRKLLKIMADAGAPLLMGTDSPQMFNVPGFALHRELRLMGESGLTPYQVLESGTKNVGLYVERDLKQDGKFGTVAVGNWADLVLLDANPLQSLDNVTRRAGVMVRGRWVPKSEIDTGLAALAARYAAQ